MNPKNLPDVCVIAALRGAIRQAGENARTLESSFIENPPKNVGRKTQSTDAILISERLHP